jgi:hypothetical protein
MSSMVHMVLHLVMPRCGCAPSSIVNRVVVDIGPAKTRWFPNHTQGPDVSCSVPTTWLMPYPSWLFPLFSTHRFTLIRSSASMIGRVLNVSTWRGSPSPIGITGGPGRVAREIVHDWPSDPVLPITPFHCASFTGHMKMCLPTRPIFESGGHDPTAFTCCTCEYLQAVCPPESPPIGVPNDRTVQSPAIVEPIDTHLSQGCDDQVLCGRL